MTPYTAQVLQDVLDERRRQVARYGINRDLVSGTGPETRWLLPFTSKSAVEVEAALRADYEDYEEDADKPTWVHLVREELAEAFLESDPERLRDELVQVAALVVSWMERLDEGKDTTTARLRMGLSSFQHTHTEPRKV